MPAPFVIGATLYFPESDILLIGGNGLFAVINATLNQETSSTYISVFNPDNYACPTLKRITNDSFVASFNKLNSLRIV